MIPEMRIEILRVIETASPWRLPVLEAHADLIAVHIIHPIPVHAKYLLICAPKSNGFQVPAYCKCYSITFP
jgi:hypothetical protein